MGYRSEVRVLLPEEEFNAMDKKLSALEDGKPYRYEIKQIRLEYDSNEPGKTPKKYVYFGWDWIKWDDEYEDVRIVSETIEESEDCQFMRFGEDMDDTDAIYKLEGNVEGIGYRRGFDDEEEKPPCPHCEKPFGETTLIYRDGGLLVNTSIDFCPKCGKKIQGGTACA